MASLHGAGEVCQNVVRAYNKHVYKIIIQRWIGGKLLTGDWIKDKEDFTRLFKLFHSKQDGAGPSTAYNAYRSLRHIIEKSIEKPTNRAD